MTKTPFFIVLLISAIWSCNTTNSNTSNVITTDIDNFWEAFDQVQTTTDTTQQDQYLKELFFDKGTPGLKAIMEVRNYTPAEYRQAINSYPTFWVSIRENTYKADKIGAELDQGIEKLRAVYPELKPAKIYFTIGALRTNGTTMDSMVLIGSELALADEHTSTEEFPEASREDRSRYFATNPIDNVVLLNVHEYVHTQQNPIVHNLLSQCLFEGVAEFVSVKAMGVPSASPAIEFGKKNEDRVRAKFEEEMFRGNATYNWLWSAANNDFDIRDLGYYIGYEICERYYNAAEDKQQAIKTLIELDYHNEPQIEAFVDGTNFLSAPLEELYQTYEAKRPKVVAIKPFENGNQEVDAKINQITITFSKQMDQYYRNFDYGPLGEDHVVRFKKLIGYSEDGKSLSFEIEPLEPNKQYQLLVQSGFRDLEGTPLKPYLIDFKTKTK